MVEIRISRSPIKIKATPSENGSLYSFLRRAKMALSSPKMGGFIYP